MKVASSIGISHTATPDLVKKTVQAALARANLVSANSVILLLTPDFAKDLPASIQAAAAAAQTTQVIGCMAPCIFTEEDWVTDAAGVAVLVMDDSLQWATPADNLPNQPILTITAPHALNTSWMTQQGMRFGAVAGDATGFGSYTVWKNGKGAPESYLQKAMTGVDVSLQNMQLPSSNADLTSVSHLNSATDASVDSKSSITSESDATQYSSHAPADFALLFSSLADLSFCTQTSTRLARPLMDEKLKMIHRIYGHLPMLGFLGNGQIVPSSDTTKPCVIRSNTSLLALFKAH